MLWEISILFVCNPGDGNQGFKQEFYMTSPNKGCYLFKKKKKKEKEEKKSKFLV